MCSDPRELSQCCALYSAIGALFMLWVGILLSSQPFYVAGIKDVDRCRDSARGAMATFVATLVASSCYLCYDARCGGRCGRRRRRRRYGRLDGSSSSSHDDGEGMGGSSRRSSWSSLPPGMTDYRVSVELTEAAASASPYPADAPTPSPSMTDDEPDGADGPTPSLRPSVTGELT